MSEGAAAVVVRKEVVVEERYCYDGDTELTIHKTSVFSKGDGFIVYDSVGQIMFRVDSFGSVKHHLLLMDPTGEPLLTLLPKRPTLHHRWEGFKGEKSEGQQKQPIFSAWKSTIIGRSSAMVQVYSTPSAQYKIDGCYSERRCTISRLHPDYGPPKLMVAQIKLKVDPIRDIEFGRDVFSLVVKAGFDAAFAMGLVLALDRINGDNDVSCSSCHHVVI